MNKRAQTERDIREQIAAWEQQISDLSYRIEAAQGQEQRGLQKQLDTLTVHKGAAQVKLDELRDASDHLLEDIQREWRLMRELFNAYYHEHYEELKTRSRDVIAEVDSRIQQMEETIAREWSELGTGARRSVEDALRELRKQRVHLTEYYGALAHSGTEAIEELKGGFFSAYSALDEAMGRARQHLNNITTRSDERKALVEKDRS